ncbi:MAG: tRNA 2-thiouridine(34) synthase MnmA [Pseudomonadota bacterium]
MKQNKHMNKDKKVTVGLSGGVDSAVTALLLQQQGYDVSAIFMKNWNEDDATNYCPAEEDYADAQTVAAKLKFPLKAVNFAAEYWDKVFKFFLATYKQGHTPNPDILCNKEIKFKVFLDFALSDKGGAFGADKIATGHYAQVDEQQGEYFLLKGKDISKDQSYFLYTLGQDQLAKVLFPLGELDKIEVRKLAEQNHLDVYDKKDSTGICFIGERNFNKFLGRFLKSKPGDIISDKGEIVGKHQGLIYHTLGQRKGLGIGGSKNSTGEPWFAAEKNLEKNQLIVVQGKNNPLLYQQHLSASQLHWVSGNAPKTPFTCTAKTRYRQQDQQCIIQSIEDGICQVSFSQSQFAITPGQSVVFYQQMICLGGGIIEHAN